MNMKTAFQLEIIDKLRKERLEHPNHYVQRDIAVIIGKAEGLVGNIESHNGKNKYSLADIYKICKALGCNVEHLFVDDYDFHKSQQDIIQVFLKKVIEYENGISESDLDKDILSK